MPRDNTYRWISPLKASDYYVGHDLHLDFEESSVWLRPHVESGTVKVKFDGIEITPAIAKIVLAYFDIMNPTEKGRLPSDFLLLRPDVERVLARRTGDVTKRSGRPAKAGSLADTDLPLTTEMNRLLSTRVAISPTAAAKILVERGDVAGGGTDDSKVRRLVQRYKGRFGDDG